MFFLRNIFQKFKFMEEKKFHFTIEEIKQLKHLNHFSPEELKGAHLNVITIDGKDMVRVEPMEYRQALRITSDFLTAYDNKRQNSTYEDFRYPLPH